VYDGEAARVVENEQGQRLTPSVVAFQDDGETLVGQPAKKLLFSRSAISVSGHQLLLGVPYDSPECRDFLDSSPASYTVAAAADGKAAIQVHGVLHSPSDIASRPLSQLKANAERAMGGRSIISAVIGMPTAANDAVREAIGAAARRAGLQQLELLPAAVAAAMAAEEELGKPIAEASSLGVLELNGRSSAFSVLGRTAEPLAWEVVVGKRQRRHGAEQLEGMLVAHLVAEFRQTEGIDLSSDHLAMQRLHEAAESAKMQLCSSLQASVSLPFITADINGPKHMDVLLSRARFAGIVAPALEGMLSICDEALAAAAITPSDLDAVLVVGGAARAPPLIELVESYFGRAPLRTERPEESVALGAAAHARQLQALQYGA